MLYGEALENLSKGYNVCRAGWNGKNMFLVLVKGDDYEIRLGSDAEFSLPMDCKLLPWIGMKTADNKFVPWLASQTDMLADDWTVL